MGNATHRVGGIRIHPGYPRVDSESGEKKLENGISGEAIRSAAYLWLASQAGHKSEILALVNIRDKVGPPEFSIRMFGYVFVLGSQTFRSRRFVNTAEINGTPLPTPLLWGTDATVEP